jgi:hypothetical protein
MRDLGIDVEERPNHVRGDGRVAEKLSYVKG